MAYTTSKGAVLAMSRELAVIHARENIRVNALCPGPLNTELLQKYLCTPELKNRRLVHVPMGRFGEAEEIGLFFFFIELIIFCILYLILIIYFVVFWF